MITYVLFFSQTYALEKHQCTFLCRLQFLLSPFLYFRCDRAGLAGTIRLAAVRCPAGLAFDIQRQTCDWKAKVDNCDRLSSKSKKICRPNSNSMYNFA